MPGASHSEPEYAAARRVLLDALAALGQHRASVVLVGAQAIYLRLGEGDLAVAPYTTDGDLAIDPRGLADTPLLGTMLEAAGFGVAVKPGSWVKDGVQVDFLVPAALGGGGRRGARLGAHGASFARKSAGLEAAVVDRDQLRVTGLDQHESRTFDIAVAGVAALLVAKLHKLHERLDTPGRLQDKDALDVLRLLRGADRQFLSERLTTLAVNPVAGKPTRRARDLLRKLFADAGAPGSVMAVRATAGLEDPDTIAASCEALASLLLEVWTTGDEEV